MGDKQNGSGEDFQLPVWEVIPNESMDFWIFGYEYRQNPRHFKIATTV